MNLKKELILLRCVNVKDMVVGLESVGNVYWRSFIKMRICMCKFIKRDEKTKTVEEGCNAIATKKCKHGFYTCPKHYHGCKDEEEK